MQATEPASTTGEALAIVVNRKNPVSDLSLDQLRKLCLGDQKVWPDGGNVTVALREKGQPERDAVLRQIYRMSENSFARYVLKISTGDEAQNVPKELATAKHVCRFVFNVPGAIGFVRAGEVDGSVKVIRLDGVAITDSAYKFKLPGQ